MFKILNIFSLMIMTYDSKWKVYLPLEISVFFTSVFLPGESQGRGSLVGCRLWGHTEWDMTEVT